MSLHALFSPRSIAVIGASTQPGSVGNDIAKNLLESDFAGKVYPVNPKADSLFGVPCFKSVGDIPDAVDLAIIVVPAKIVPTVLREAGEKMVRAAVVISAGFKETGPEGQALETEIRTIAEEHHISLLGPNCLGFIEPRLFLNASFASAIPQAGNIAFFSQSGALMSALLDQAKSSLGFSSFVSIGNKAAIDEQALLKYFKNDATTTTLGFYSENLTDASQLIQTGRSLLSGEITKPVIALKSGKTDAGTHASSSHTGAVAGSAAAYSALFRQAHMTEAATFEELIDLLTVFSKNPLPKGKQIAIVTNAGGLGVLATDAAVNAGLKLAPLSDETKGALRALLPPAASVGNPVDVLGDALADRYQKTLEVIARDPAVDLLLVLLTPQTMTEPEKTAASVLRIREKMPHLPLVAVFSGQSLVKPGKDFLEKNHIAVLSFPEAAAQALGRLAQAGEWSTSPERPVLEVRSAIELERTERLLREMPSGEEDMLGSLETEKILSAYGFPFLQSSLATSAREAKRLAQAIGKPVALKIVSPDIIHKSDVGGVLLNVAPAEVDDAYDHMLETIRKRAPQAKIEGVQIVEMSRPGGTELLLGLKREPGLGTVLVFGLGGIYVETFQDVALRFVPVTEADIDEQIREIKSFPLLTGTRGQKGVDLEALKLLLARFSQFALDFPEVVELDLNPLVAYEHGRDFRILDARMKFEK